MVLWRQSAVCDKYIARVTYSLRSDTTRRHGFVTNPVSWRISPLLRKRRRVKTRRRMVRKPGDILLTPAGADMSGLTDD